MVSLEVWIEDLHHRLKRGDFARRGPITLRNGSRFHDTELAVRIMLADLAHIEEVMVDRRQDLLNDFQHLRDQLAG